MEGVDAMQQQREGKTTLRSHEVEDLPPLEVDADLIRDTRERLHVSRAVFARRLRISLRTSKHGPGQGHHAYTYTEASNAPSEMKKEIREEFFHNSRQ